MKRLVQQLGYVLDLVNNIWINPTYEGIAYNDGDEVEMRIASIIKQTLDVSVLSTELRQHCTDWPSLYHLSGARANIMRPFENMLKGDVLEIGAGCGAITRYLGECSANVLALEGSPRRAAIARSRTRDLDNVTVLAESFDQFQFDHKFDVITLVGVLEYANLFTSGQNPQLAMLERASRLLKPDGKLIIAIENQLGLKYFAGAPEDHLGQPMVGIEGRYLKDQPQTFGRKVLAGMLDQAGFAASEFLTPFPDYKLPVSILTEKGIKNKDFDAAALAWQSVRRDPQLPPYCNFSLELAWPEVFKNGIALDVANSFLIIAAPKTQQLTEAGVLAYYYSVDRISTYCKETVFIRNNGGDVRVEYRRLGTPDESTDEANNPLIKFIPSDSEEYVFGKPLSLEFINIVTKDGWSFDQVARFVWRYLSIVETFAKSTSMQVSLTSPYAKLPGEFFDVTPQNIIISDDGSSSLIDKEWRLVGSIEVAHLLFRSLLWLGNSINRFGRPVSGVNMTKYQFIDRILAAVGLRLQDNDYARYITLEGEIQQAVTGSTTEEFFACWRDQLLPILSLSQVVAERDGQIANLNQVLSARDGQIAGLTQAVHDKHVHIDNITQMVAERDGQIAGLTQTVLDKHVHIDNITQMVAERDGQIADLTQTVHDKHVHIDNITQMVAERDGQIAGLTQTVHDKHVHIDNLDRALRKCEEQISNYIKAAADIRGSTSWRLTSPIRLVGRQLLRIKIILTALSYALPICGGYRGLIKHTWRTYKNQGINGVKRRILFLASPGARAPVIQYTQPTQSKDSPKPNHNDYDEWVRCYDTLTDQNREQIKSRINQLHKAPLISVVMPVYDPPLDMLEDAIRSVQGQLYPNWELCIADDTSTDKDICKLLQRYADNDSRIKVIFRRENGHISAASNSALELVSGEYIALLDHDDLLSEQALFWVADAIVSHPGAGLIYSDEDKIDQSGRRYDPYFKPGWNPDLFLSQNMICHLGVYRTDLVRQLGGFRKGYEGAQDYDLALRCTEQLAHHQIVHIPRVLYHWRSHPGSTAQAGSEKNYALLAGESALNDHFARAQIAAEAELLNFGMYRARYFIPAPAPLVSLIIPTRNGLDLIKQCVDSIFAKTTYKNYEILVVDNNSDDPKTLAYFASLAGDNRIRFLRDERPFNYSALNNAAVQQVRGEYVGLLNNDVEVISPKWLEEMMGLAIQPGVGAVGARLWYPNDTLQHGGCITGIGGVAGHSHKYLPRGQFGYFARAQLIQTLSAVTAACLVIKKSIYQAVGGLDETNLKVAFNDVDFCLRVREAGYRTVWTPYAELYHHESATRGIEDTPEKQLRFSDEVRYMKNRWGDALVNDPAYSPNLTLVHEDFSYAWPPRVAFLNH